MQHWSIVLSVFELRLELDATTGCDSSGGATSQKPFAKTFLIIFAYEQSHCRTGQIKGFVLAVAACTSC